MILLCHSNAALSEALAGRLEAHSLANQVHQLHELSSEHIPPGVQQAVAILPEQNVVQTGEWVSQLRSLVGSSIPLIVCGPQVTPADRQLLVDCGATTLITPASWDAAAVAERVLAELTLLGAVQPLGLGGLRGASVEMLAVYRKIEVLAPLRETVLVLGETGCGKELVAREIHARSGRGGELMAINCAALSPELLESELFGHEKGAFSGAVSRRKGLFREAGRGTVFLDEIGDLDLSSQAKLLRALEERKVRPVGGNTWQPFEARLVFATNRDLEEARASQEFRADLHERLKGFSITLPPLRERREDLALLVDHFLEEYNRDYPGKRSVAAGALDPLFRYHWPGNVRELRMAVRQAATFANSSEGSISTVHLHEVALRTSQDAGTHVVTFDPVVDPWRQVLERVRAKYFRAVLAECGGQKDVAARRAGMSRSQFYEILRQISDS